MGREIRRVPLDWQHPKDEHGNDQPMHDRLYSDAAREWKDGFLLWEKAEHPDQKKYPDETKGLEFWEWHTNPPDPEYYRQRKWTKEQAVGYQVYETVSEGTPTSPVFKSKEDLIEWLVKEGHSRHAAETFAEKEWAPSGLIVAGKIGKGIDSYDLT